MNHAPKAIGNSQSKQQLRLNWGDGREQLLGHAQLRRQCPCSQCRAFRLQGLNPVVSSGIRLLEVNPQGYGLQLVFSDGHERGIYPWSYLAGLGEAWATLSVLPAACDTPPVAHPPLC